MPVNPATVKALFLEVVDIGDPAARAARLQERAGSDAQLLARVHALLAANDQARESDTVSSKLNTDSDIDQFSPASDTAFPTTDLLGKNETVGAVIADRY